MPETCITCLSTANLVKLGVQEWSVIDFLLHPFSKQYPYLKHNRLARLCMNCQSSLRSVEKFRFSALKNFMYLINVWKMPESSTNVASKTFIPKVKVLDVKSLQEKGDNTPRDILKPLPKTENVYSVIMTHKIKEVKEENLSESDGEETDDVICRVPDLFVKTEQIDEVQQIEIEIKEETEVDSEATITDEEFVSLRENDEANKKLIPIMQPTATASKSSDVKSGYWCRYCEKSFKSCALVEQHEEIKHGNLPTVTCTVCKKTIKNKYSLEKHMTMVHKHEKIYCDVCDISFQRNYYKRHLETSPNHNSKEELEALKTPCPICNKISKNKTNLKTHMNNMHTTAKYCQPCDKWFNAAAYRSHIKTSLKHVSETDKRFECNECGAKFITKSEVCRHIQTKHLKIMPFKCSLCPRAFSTKTRLTYHIRYVHDNVPVPKNHICEVCGHAFSNSSLLRKHMPVHTGERPYKCGKCDATFGHRSALYLHNRYKHDKQKCPPKKKKNVTKPTKQS